MTGSYLRAGLGSGVVHRAGLKLANEEEKENDNHTKDTQQVESIEVSSR